MLLGPTLAEGAQEVERDVAASVANVTFLVNVAASNGIVQGLDRVGLGGILVWLRDWPWDAQSSAIGCDEKGMKQQENDTNDENLTM